MIDLMQEVEFVKVGKLYIIKNGDGTRYTEEEVKNMMRKNNKELQEKVEKPRKKAVKNESKHDSIEETSQVD